MLYEGVVVTEKLLYSFPYFNIFVLFQVRAIHHEWGRGDEGYAGAVQASATAYSTAGQY